MDNSELEKLYKQYEKELFLYAFSFTKNKIDAEELVSDAFFQLTIQDTFPKNIKFWLFLVVKNKFIDSTRKKKRWSFFQIDDLKIKAEDNVELPLLKKENYQQLYQAIDNLKPPYKEMTLLFYFLDWSTNEIAEFLFLSVNQVRVGLHRSRKQLKEALKHDD